MLLVGIRELTHSVLNVPTQPEFREGLHQFGEIDTIVADIWARVIIEGDGGASNHIANHFGDVTDLHVVFRTSNVKCLIVHQFARGF